MPKDARSVERFACSLDPHDAGERRRRFDELCARALMECLPTETGLRLHFRPHAQVEEELWALARLEANCCAFARFEVTRRADFVRLEVIAPPEGADTVRRLFGPRPEPSSAGRENS